MSQGLDKAVLKILKRSSNNFDPARVQEIALENENVLRDYHNAEIDCLDAIEEEGRDRGAAGRCIYLGYFSAKRPPPRPWNRSNQKVKLCPNNLLRFWARASMEVYGASVSSEQLKLLATITVLKTYFHELFHEQSWNHRLKTKDVSASRPKTEREREEAMAVAYSRRCVELCVFGEKVGRTPLTDYAKLGQKLDAFLDLLYEFRSPGYCDWRQFYSNNTFDRVAFEAEAEGMLGICSKVSPDTANAMAPDIAWQTFWHDSLYPKINLLEQLADHDVCKINDCPA